MTEETSQLFSQVTDILKDPLYKGLRGNKNKVFKAFFFANMLIRNKYKKS